MLFKGRVGVTSQPSLPRHCGSLCPQTSPTQSLPVDQRVLLPLPPHPHLREMPSWDLSPVGGLWFRRKSYKNEPYRIQPVSPAAHTEGPASFTCRASDVREIQRVLPERGTAAAWLPQGPTGWPLHTALVTGLIFLPCARPALRPRVLVCLISLFFSMYSGLHILQCEPFPIGGSAVNSLTLPLPLLTGQEGRRAGGGGRGAGGQEDTPPPPALGGVHTHQSLGTNENPCFLALASRDERRVQD